MEEQDLIAKCRGGKIEFFGGLYDIYAKKIYDFLYYRTHHKQTAEDLTSLVFNKALQKIWQYEQSKAKFSTWLYQIAKNSLTDHYRTLKLSENIDEVWYLASGANIERDTDTALILQRVREYLKDLPLLQRNILIMRLWEDLPHSEIAEILGISEANSKVTFSRGISKLRVEMGALALLYLITLKL